jgi:hypothetical protein
MMEAARTSETSVDNYFTRQYIPEDNSEFYGQPTLVHVRRSEALRNKKAKRLTALRMKAVSASESSVYLNYITQSNTIQDSHTHPEEDVVKRDERVDARQSTPLYIPAHPVRH